jgi:CheY-like chemotaxis protein
MPEETILVVDDEIANLQKLCRTFINRYSVLTASSGVEALELVRCEKISRIHSPEFTEGSLRVFKKRAYGIVPIHRGLRIKR